MPDEAIGNQPRAQLSAPSAQRKNSKAEAPLTTGRTTPAPCTSRTDATQCNWRSSTTESPSKATLSSTYLTPAELTELTGYKQTKGHIRWLNKYRWRYALHRTERPLVFREYFLDRMGLSRNLDTLPNAINAAAALQEPDFSALERL